MKKKKAFSELVIGLGCIVLGIAVYIAAGQLQHVKLGIGPAGFPKFVAVLLVVLGAAQTIPVLTNGVEAPKFNLDKRAAGLFVAAIAMAIVYVLLVAKFGFILLTTALLVGYMYLFGERNWIKMLIISVITTVCIWLLFTEVFMIFLPTGQIFA